MTASLWTQAQAVEATGGTSAHDWRADDVCIDSRQVKPGDLFVALCGARYDGHDFVDQAFAGGAAAAMISRPVTQARSHTLRVADTHQALRALAAHRRHHVQGSVIAVTGSVGKTGVKDALAHVLGRRHVTHATRGNLNNQLGLPLTLARTPLEAQRIVLEMGMGQPGDIAPLARLARPHLGIIVAVAKAHAQSFSGLTDIALEKAAIFTDMRDGVAILPRDNPFFSLLRDEALTHGAKHIVSFGTHPESDARLLSYRFDESVDFSSGAHAPTVTACIHGQNLTYRLGVLGRHWALNTLAVLAASDVLGDDLARSADSLGHFVPQAGRGNFQKIGNVTLFDESYNANPASMRAAISVLGHVRPGPGGRRIAALGDMLELGDAARHHHSVLASHLVAAGVDLVFATGPNMNALYNALPCERRGSYRPTADLLALDVAAAVHDGDVVTVKGSRDSRMFLIADALRAQAPKESVSGESVSGKNASSSAHTPPPNP